MLQFFMREHQGSVTTGTFKSAMQPHCSLYRRQSASFWWAGKIVSDRWVPGCTTGGVAIEQRNGHSSWAYTKAPGKDHCPFKNTRYTQCCKKECYAAAWKYRYPPGASGNSNGYLLSLYCRPERSSSGKSIFTGSARKDDEQVSGDHPGAEIADRRPSASWNGSIYEQGKKTA